MNSPRIEEVHAAWVQGALQELRDAFAKIQHCARQLDERQIWHRPQPSMNSIANLILHLRGNLRQWVVSGVGGGEDVRDRPSEFSRRDGISKDDLLSQLSEVVGQAEHVLSSAAPEDFVRVRTVQGFDVTGAEAVIDALAHFRGHTQEIVHLTRCQLKDAYQFSFVPQTPEQGAPSD